MMSEKSLLNPYASPYAPLSKTRHETHNKDATESLISPANEVDTRYSQFADVFSEYRIYDFKESDVPNQIVAASQEYGAFENHEMAMHKLSSMFPGLSEESLADILDVNHGDLSETIDMLDELEYGGFGYGDLPEASEMRPHSDPAPHEASSSRDSGSA